MDIINKVTVLIGLAVKIYIFFFMVLTENYPASKKMLLNIGLI